MSVGPLQYTPVFYKPLVVVVALPAVSTCIVFVVTMVIRTYVHAYLAAKAFHYTVDMYSIVAV